jgi:hypothetical protein
MQSTVLIGETWASAENVPGRSFRQGGKSSAIGKHSFHLIFGIAKKQQSSRIFSKNQFPGMNLQRILKTADRHHVDCNCITLQNGMRCLPRTLSSRIGRVLLRRIVYDGGYEGRRTPSSNLPRDFMVGHFYLRRKKAIRPSRLRKIVAFQGICRLFRIIRPLCASRGMT